MAVPPSCLYLCRTQIHKHGYRTHSSAHKYARKPLGRMHKYAYLCHSCRYYTQTHTHRVNRGLLCVCVYDILNSYTQAQTQSHMNTDEMWSDRMSLSVIFYFSCHPRIFISISPFSFSISVCPVLPCHSIPSGLRGRGGLRQQKPQRSKRALQSAELGKRSTQKLCSLNAVHEHWGVKI